MITGNQPIVCSFLRSK